MTQLTQTEFNKKASMIRVDDRLKFKPDLIRSIIEGRKTQTRRLKDKGFEEGTLLYIHTSDYMFRSQTPAILRVTQLDEEEYPCMHFWSAMQDEWAVKEGLEHRNEFFDVMRECYPDAEINGQTFLYMTSFEVVHINPEWQKKLEETIR